MSLFPNNLSSIQKAGQAVHDSTVDIAAAVRTQAESLVASMANTPFSMESEQMVSRFKKLSKLSQGLVAVEAQLQDLYAMAVELTNPAPEVIVLTSITKRKVATNSDAVDVVSKPAKPAKVAKKPRMGGPMSGSLTPNDTKLLGYLQGALKGGDAKMITGSVLAAGSGLPLGSVGVSLKKIIASGAVNQLGRGTYQLGSTAANVTALAQEPVVKSAPAKKVKPAVAKEVKAKPVKAAKAASAKKVKVSPAKKARSGSGDVAATVEVTASAVEAAAL